MTTIYLGVADPNKSMRAAVATSTTGLFVSFPYLKHWRREVTTKKPWGFDCGAYTAAAQGKTIDRDEYLETALTLQRSANPPQDLFYLDVIGDWRASGRNFEWLRARGLQGIPTWHLGSPESVLLGLTREYPKIAVGGIARGLVGPRRVAFLRQVFDRIWPAKVHGFGVLDRPSLEAVPFHTVDGTSWLGCLRFGRWAAYGNATVSVSGWGRDACMGPEVRHFEQLQAAIKAKWERELASLEVIR